MNLLLRCTALVLLLVIVTVGGLAAAYRLHPKVRKKTNDIVYVIQHPNASYDERMTWQMGNEYRLYKLVTANTPPDAVILLAPAPDVSLRNRGRMGYFFGIGFPACKAHGSSSAQRSRPRSSDGASRFTRCRFHTAPVLGPRARKSTGVMD